MSPKKSSNENGGLSTDLIKKFIENQSQELTNESQEIELKKLNEKNGYDYACKALEAQKEDRKEHRKQVTLFMKYGFWLTIVFLIFLALFVWACIYTDNIHIIISVLKVSAYMIPSAVGGYFIGLNKGKKVHKGNNSATYAEIVDNE